MMSTVSCKDTRLVLGSVNVTEDGTKESEVNQRLSVEEKEVEVEFNFCQRRDVFWSLLFTLTAILIVFVSFTVIHAHTGKEFTVQNITYTTVSIVSCIVGICIIITCRLAGRKHRRNHKYIVQDKRSTKNNASSRGMIHKTKGNDTFGYTNGVFAFSKTFLETIHEGQLLWRQQCIHTKAGELTKGNQL